MLELYLNFFKKFCDTEKYGELEMNTDSLNLAMSEENKRTLKDCGDGPMSNYRKLLEEAVNVTSTNRRFRTMKHSVAT